MCKYDIIVKKEGYAVKKNTLKIFVCLAIATLLFTACSTPQNIPENTKPSDKVSQTPSHRPNDADDKGEVKYEDEYTLSEILEIKTNWNKEYVFPCDISHVQIEEENDTNLVMSLKTQQITYNDALVFYENYTLDKKHRNVTNTKESCLITFEEEYVSRTIMVVQNAEDVMITITYSMDNVNKR